MDETLPPLSVILPELDRCDDNEVLWLHRMISQRAATIYGPRFKVKQEANYRASPAGAFQRARRASQTSTSEPL